VIRVGIGEQQVELARAQLGVERLSFLLHLLLELRVSRGQLIELDQVAGALFQPVP
jgi:hypothetical protein